MRPTYNDFVTKESRKKLPSADKNSQSATPYTKSDYLTPGKVAKKFNMSVEEAKKAMNKILFKRAAFTINGHKAPVITRFGTSNIYLHPMGVEAFKKYLDEQKG